MSQIKADRDIASISLITSQKINFEWTKTHLDNIPKNATVFITHTHSMYRFTERRGQGERAVFSNRISSLSRQGGVNVIGWEVSRNRVDKKHHWWESLRLLDTIWMQAEESRDSIAICSKYDQGWINNFKEVARDPRFDKHLATFVDKIRVVIDKLWVELDWRQVRLELETSGMVRGLQ